MKPYYEDESVTIHHGDCREILPYLKPVDLVLTDPPYGANKSKWDEQFPSYIFSLLDAPIIAIIPGISNLVLMPTNIGNAIYRWTLAVRITNGMTRGAMGFGNWIACPVWAKEGVSVYGTHQDCGEVFINGNMPDHPTPKPLSAILWLLERLPGDTILDPFMGSGTTLRAAKDLGRKAIGIEIEERYCEIAAKRMSQTVMAL